MSGGGRLKLKTSSTPTTSSARASVKTPKTIVTAKAPANYTAKTPLSSKGAVTSYLAESPVIAGTRRMPAATEEPAISSETPTSSRTRTKAASLAEYPVIADTRRISAAAKESVNTQTTTNKQSSGITKLKSFSSATPSSSYSSFKTHATDISKGLAKNPSETLTSSTTRTKALSRGESPAETRRMSAAAETTTKYLSGCLLKLKHFSSYTPSSADSAERDETFRIPLTPSTQKDLEPSLKKGGIFLQRYNDSSYLYEAKGWSKTYNKTVTAEDIFKTCRVWTEEDAKIAKEDVTRRKKKSGRSSKGSEQDSAALKEDVDDDVKDSEKHATPSKTSSELDALRRRPCYKLINLEFVFPPKNTVAEMFKKYAEKKKSLFSNRYYLADFLITMILPSVEEEFNTHLPFCLTAKELTEWFIILNTKRASLNLPPIDMKKSKGTPLPKLMVSMLDSFDVLYFVRFVKRMYERTNAIMEKGDENRLPVTKSPIKDLIYPILKDILNFIDNTIDMEKYDSLMGWF